MRFKHWFISVNTDSVSEDLTPKNRITSCKNWIIYPQMGSDCSHNVNNNKYRNFKTTKSWTVVLCCFIAQYQGYTIQRCNLFKLYTTLILIFPEKYLRFLRHYYFYICYYLPHTIHIHTATFMPSNGSNTPAEAGRKSATSASSKI